MPSIFAWILRYVFPSLFAVQSKSNTNKSVSRIIRVHFLLAVSIGLFALSGVFFVWTVTPYSLLALLVSSIFAVLLLGKLGAAYIPSCFIQEWVLLLAGPSLYTIMPFLPAALLTALPFAWAHKGNQKTWKNWIMMSVPYMLWAVTTLYLYEWLHQPLYNVALHLFVGVVLVRFGILFKHHKELPWLLPR